MNLNVNYTFIVIRTQVKVLDFEDSVLSTRYWNVNIRHLDDCICIIRMPESLKAYGLS